jgi:hypothetical protein
MQIVACESVEFRSLVHIEERKTTMADKYTEWHNRATRPRVKIGQTSTVENLGEISEFLKQWPQFIQGTNEYEEANEVKKQFKLDDPRHFEMWNIIEQGQRQAIIEGEIEKNFLMHKGANILGIAANDRLEAICEYEIMKVGHNEWPKWLPGKFTTILYVHELASAPWNVGWPTTESGVKGGPTALFEVLKDKAKNENCDAIALCGLLCNIRFYRNEKIGFSLAVKEEDMGPLPPLFMEVKK